MDHGPAVLAQEDAIPIMADQVRALWHSRLDGTHFLTKIRMEVDFAGLTETRAPLVSLRMQ